MERINLANHELFDERGGVRVRALPREERPNEVLELDHPTL